MRVVIMWRSASSVTNPSPIDSLSVFLKILADLNDLTDVVIGTKVQRANVHLNVVY